MNRPISMTTKDLPGPGPSRVIRARWIFILSAVIPLVAVSASAAWWRWGRPAWLAYRFALAAHVDLTAEKVDPVRPGVDRWRAVRLRDVSRGDSFLARAAVVEIEHGPRGVVVRPLDVSVHRESLPWFWTYLRRHLMPEQQRQVATWVLALPTLRIMEGTTALESRELRARIEPSPEGPRFHLEFLPPGVATGEPVRIRCIQPNKAHGITELELHCDDTPLPCALLRWDGGTTPGCDERTRFQGHAFLKYAPHAVEGEWIGWLREVDLRPWLQGVCDISMSLRGEVRVDRAEFANGRLRRLDATLVAGPGEVTPGELAAFAKHFGLGQDPQLSDLESAGPIALESLSLRVRLEDDRILISGGDESRPAEICRAGGQALTLSPEAPAHEPRETLRVARILDEALRGLPFR